MEVKMGTAKAVDDALLVTAANKEKRTYMGTSYVGKECERAVFYEYRYSIPNTDPRVERIFDLGHVVEALIVKWLRNAGITVWDVQGNGEQFGFEDGPLAGHIDGIVTGLPESSAPHLLECKSANSKRFEEFKEKGVKAVSREYFIQVQIYMLKMDVQDCLFVIMNKDTCELYFERIKLDKDIANNAIMRGKELATTNEVPDRKFKSSTFYKCRFCKYNSMCWEA